MTVVAMSGKHKEKGPVMSDITDPEFQERITSAQAWLADQYKSKGTWKKVADEVGEYDESSISLFARGRYPSSGTPLRLLAVVEQAQDFAEDRAKNVFKPRFVETSLARAMQRAFRQTRSRGALGVLSSESGCGKSATWLEIAKTDSRVVIMRANPTLMNRPWPLISSLLKAAGEANWEGKQPSRAFEFMVENFRSGKKSLVIDEAQFVSQAGLDLLRCLSEDAGIPILFSGNAQIYERGLMTGANPAAFTQFQSRIQVDEHVRTEQITPADVHAIASQLVPADVLDEEEVRAALLSEAQSPGGFRRLISVLQRAMERARRGDITKAHVLQSAGEMPLRGGVS